jgi:hypothetical protein
MQASEIRDTDCLLNTEEYGNVDIKMDLGEIGIDGANPSPVAGFCEHGDEPSGSVRKRDLF